jgi:hypothetical protein
VKRINGSLLVGHEYVSRALGELRQIRKTPSSTNGVLHHDPEAFERIMVVPTMRWQARKAQLGMRVVKGRVKLVLPVDPAPSDDHHDLFPSCAAGGHHGMEILASLNL